MSSSLGFQHVPIHTWWILISITSSLGSFSSSISEEQTCSPQMVAIENLNLDVPVESIYSKGLQHVAHMWTFFEKHCRVCALDSQSYWYFAFLSPYYKLLEFSNNCCEFQKLRFESLFCRFIEHNSNYIEGKESLLS